MKRSIDCTDFDKHESAYLDGQLSVDNRQKVSAHLRVCVSCRDRARRMTELRRVMRAMPARSTPADLRTRLHILASREIARRRERTNWWQERRQRMRLWMHDLMRPLALPAAGGVLSAILLFGTIGPYLLLPGVAQSAVDVSTGLYTDPTVKATLPVGFEPDEIEVELSIDEQGRMMDYTVLDNHCRTLLAKSESLRRTLESHLLVSRFTPATFFNQPTGGKIRLTFRTSRIDVRG
jgi:Putative zinc-finger